MASTLISGGLSSLHTQSVWISKERVLACVSDNGLVSCLYHGNQAVSRNSYILKGTIDNPAVKFIFENEGSIVPHSVLNCEYSIDSCTLEVDAGGFPYSIKICAGSDSIGVRVEARRNDCRHTFSAEIDTSGLYRNVYGRRNWVVDSNESHLVKLTADDRTRISEWVKMHGSFLVPMETQNHIYKKDALSDVTFSENGPVLRENYIDELIIDSCIVTEISGNGFERSFSNEEKLVFSACSCFCELTMKFSYMGSSTEKSMGSNQICQEQERYIPELIHHESPGLMELFSFIPSVIDSVIQSDSCMPRACAGGYYWVWGWDTIVAAMEMSKWGMMDLQRKIIDFMLAHRWKNGAVPHRFDRNYEAINVKPGVTDGLFIILCSQYVEDSGDYEWLGENYEGIREVFKVLLDHVDDDGFIMGLGTYPDNPRAMGRTPGSRVAIDSGAFYSALVCMLGFSKHMNDTETALTCRRYLEGFSMRYIEAFFDEKKMMIFDSFTTESRNLTYPLYSLVSMNNRMGIPLLLTKQAKIAEFISKEYFTKHGFRSLPQNDQNKGTECIHHSWFIYWDVCILALMRTCGYHGILETYRQNISLMWENYRTVFEFLDLDLVDEKDSKNPWKGYGCSWPIHGSVSVYRGILEGLLGLRTDMGCITILPGTVTEGASLKGLVVLNRKWNFRFTGTGDYVSEIKVNENMLRGSMVIPDSMIKEYNSIEVRRSTNGQTDLAVADIFAGRLMDIRETDEGFEASVRSDGYTTLLIQSTGRPEVICDGTLIEISKIDGMKGIYYARLYENSVIKIRNI